MRDCVEEPCHDDAVHALPVGEGVVGGISEDVAPKDQKHLVVPVGVVVRLHVEDGEDEGADVLDTDSMGVELDDGSGLMS